jgi:hypothetical protein
MWIPLFDEFGKDYTIIAPDMRGLGESCHFDHPDRHRALAELRNHMPVTGRERIFLEHFWQTLSLRAYF